MRITDEQGNALSHIYVALTDAEAKELRDGLDELVKTREKGWHAHVMDERFWAADERDRIECEVTVYRADDETMSA
jgi:cellobiose-specific phosphotransferase system component IIA